MMNKLWNFDNSYARLPKIFFINHLPTPVSKPKLIVFNDSLAEILGVPFELDVFAGNKILKGVKSISQGYAGHQFGHFTMLGDGRAVLLGEVITSQGMRFDIQLKGSGITPYSRGGDGRAALGPMLREYIISEAMFNLGIPTTRSLAVVETGENIIRQKLLKGAILTRVAASHIRVGTFEYAARFGSKEELKNLADYTIDRHFNGINNIKNNTSKYLAFFKEVINRQACLIAKWQLAGFIHGVMNTDNMAISGETIDYGPCAFMDEYDKNTVFSSIDKLGRYSYENQPKIAAWNLARLLESLTPLFDGNDITLKYLQEAINGFQSLYQQYFVDGMRNKLGLFNKEYEDKLLINELFYLMQKFRADYTNTFKALTLDESYGLDLFAAKEFEDWSSHWHARLKRQKKSKEEIKLLMKNSNPAIIPRNHQVERVLEDAEKGDISSFNEFLLVLNNPYDYSLEQEKYTKIDFSSTCRYQTFCGT